MASAVVREVLALRTQLESRDSVRNQAYDEVLLHYGGYRYKDRKKYGVFPGLRNIISSVFNRRDDEPMSSFTTPINLTRPAILNKVAFMALVPQVRVTEPPESYFDGTTNEDGTEVSPSDMASQFADELEQVLLSIWKFSNITRRCWDLAWNLGAFGGSVLGVWPDMQHERVRIFTRTPQDFWPVTVDGGDGLELSRAIWKDEIDGFEVSDRYGLKDYEGEEDVPITTSIDRERLIVVVGDKELAFPPIEHGLGFCPIVCVGNIGVPGSPFGDTDVKEAIPVSQEINYHMKLVADMAAAMVNPTIAIKDPLSVPADLAIGRGGKITMGPQGSVDLLGPIQLPNAFWGLTEQLQNWFDLISDNPAQLRGEGLGSVLTGKGFNASISPVSARMQTRLNLVLSGWEQVNRYALMMWAKFPPVSKKIKASGTKNKNYYHIEKEPKDFFIDGEIWTENEVILTSQSFMDRQGTDVELIQLAQNEYISWDTVVENLPYVTNKKRERARIDKDRKWKAEGMAIANQMAQSPATANVDVGAPEQTAYGLERGMVGEVGAPPGPSAEMPTGEPMPGGMPSPGMEEMSMPEDPMVVFEQVFAAIPKLKGKVWIGGQPMLEPDSINEDDWKLTVWVEEPQDKGTITNFAKSQYPELYGHLDFIEGPPSGDEPSVQIQGVTPGTEPTEEEAMLAEEPPETEPGEGNELDEDMMAQLGQQLL